MRHSKVRLPLSYLLRPLVCLILLLWPFPFPFALPLPCLSLSFSFSFYLSSPLPNPPTISPFSPASSNRGSQITTKDNHRISYSVISAFSLMKQPDTEFHLRVTLLNCLRCFPHQGVKIPAPSPYSHGRLSVC